MDFFNKSENNKTISFNYKLPKKIFIGFERGSTKKDYEDTKTTIFNHVKDTIESRRSAYYKIVKIKNHNFLPDGFLYEIQEEGSRYSYIDKILKELETKPSVIIKTQEKFVQVEKIYEGINCYYLTEKTDLSDRDIIHVNENDLANLKEKDKLDYVFKENYTLFVVGAILFSLSIVGLFLSCVFKYAIFNEHQQIEHVKNYDTFPIRKVSRLESTENSKVRSIIFENGEWYLQKELKNNDGKITVPAKSAFTREGSKIKKLRKKQDKRINENEK